MPSDVKSLFLAAVEKSTPAERSAFLDAACANDAELRRRVEALLLAHDQPGSLLDKPLVDCGATADAVSVETVGAEIGPYKLLQKLGKGGMGVVFVAEQERPVKRRVALKIIKPGMDSAQVLARFEAERQALALMDHTHIAKVLDAGTTGQNDERGMMKDEKEESRSDSSFIVHPSSSPQGRPYFVMELVKGVPITKYCDELNLSIRERLELFVPVCQAIQHAHQKGIIHRDIKPSNVLVAMQDGKPIAKVIDFGVAKALHHKLTERTLMTEFGAVVGTLEYMSPEQAELSALDIDTRSDVYALGALLYELLTGTTPLDRQRLRTVAFDEIRRLIREEDPPKPSTRLGTLGERLSAVSANRKMEAGKLSARLRGDLDWIVMKSLEKDRTRRYDTASAFAADVGRFLSDELVEARPPSTWYRFGKMARRNKAALTTAALVAATLVLGIIGTTIGLVYAMDAETQALTARDDEAWHRRAAEDQRQRAMAAEANAMAAEADAKNQARRALFEKQLADVALVKERAARLELRRNHYAASLSLVASAWELKHVKRAVELLDEQRPKPEDREDVRGFEWHYWDRLFHSELRTVKLESLDPTSQVAFSDDGTRLAIVTLVIEDRQVLDRRVKILNVSNGMEIQNWSLRTEQLKDTFTTKGADRPRDPLQLNRNGTRLALAVRSRVFVWDTSNKKTHHAKIEGRVGNLALSPDGNKLAIVDSNAEVKIWDVENQTLQPIIIKSKQVGILKFSPDGARLATVETTTASSKSVDSSAIHLWDASTGSIRAQTTVEAKIHDIAFSPTGFILPEKNALQAVQRGSSTLRLAFCPDDGRILVWRYGGARVIDANTGALLPVLNEYSMNAQTHAAAFSADGARLFTVDWRNEFTDRVAIMREWDSGLSNDIPSTSNVVTVRSRDRKYEAVVNPKDQGGMVVRIRDSAGKEVAVSPRHTMPISAVHFSPNGAHVFSRAGSTEYKIWETNTGKPKMMSRPKPPIKLPSNFDRNIYDQLLTPDGRFLALGNSNKGGTLRVIEFNEAKEVLTLALERSDKEPANAFSAFSRESASAYFSTNGMQLVLDYGDSFKLWNVESGKEIGSAREGKVSHVAFDRDGQMFASIDYGKAVVLSSSSLLSVTVWDSITGAKITTLKKVWTKHRNAKSEIGLDGKHLFVLNGGSTPTESTVWDIKAQKRLNRLEGFGGPVRAMAFSPDGKRIATASEVGQKGEIKLWDAATDRELLSIKTEGFEFGGDLFFSPDGYRLTFRPFAGTGFPRSEMTWNATPRAEK